MRLIDADKIYPDCMTKDGKLAISQSQLANAPTVEMNVLPKIHYERGFNAGYDSGKNARPQGEWLSHYDYCEKHGYNPSASIAFWWCEQCGQAVEQPTNFCPNCGADMRKRGVE